MEKRLRLAALEGPPHGVQDTQADASACIVEPDPIRDVQVERDGFGANDEIPDAEEAALEQHAADFFGEQLAGPKWVEHRQSTVPRFDGHHLLGFGHARERVGVKGALDRIEREAMRFPLRAVDNLHAVD